MSMPPINLPSKIPATPGKYWKAKDHQGQLHLFASSGRSKADRHDSDKTNYIADIAVVFSPDLSGAIRTFAPLDENNDEIVGVLCEAFWYDAILYQNILNSKMEAELLLHDGRAFLAGRPSKSGNKPTDPWVITDPTDAELAMLNAWVEANLTFVPNEGFTVPSRPNPYAAKNSGVNQARMSQAQAPKNEMMPQPGAAAGQPAIAGQPAAAVLPAATQPVVAGQIPTQGAAPVLPDASQLAGVPQPDPAAQAVAGQGAATPPVAGAVQPGVVQPAGTQPTAAQPGIVQSGIVQTPAAQPATAAQPAAPVGNGVSPSTYAELIGFVMSQGHDAPAALAKLGEAMNQIGFEGRAPEGLEPADCQLIHRQLIS